MSSRKKSSREIEAALGKLDDQKKKLNQELRQAKAREAAKAKAEQQRADRREADEILAYLRQKGVPQGKAVEFLQEMAKLEMNGTSVYDAILSLMQKHRPRRLT